SATSEGLLLPGGNVDPEALRRAVESAQQSPSCETADEETDAVMPRVTFSLRRDLNKRLDRYLTDRITFMSRTQLQRLIDEGGVTVNQRIPKASTLLRAGDVVEVVVPPPPSPHTQPEDIPLDVLYEDDDMVVLNKPPGIIVHPARSHLKGTLINALAFHFRHRSPSGGSLSTVGGDFARPGVVHRLDRHTSGVIVFAKRDEAHWKLGHQFEHRRVDKRYLALVEGLVEPDADVIDLPIGPHPSREKGYREKYVVRHDELGKNAVTIVRVRERYRTIRPDDPIASGAPGIVPAHGAHPAAPAPPAPPVGPHWDGGGDGHNSATRRVRPLSAPGASAGYSLVELELKTGRTHQIRVHLSHLGWPIVGDDMYGGKPYADESGATIIDRQALHACMLGIRHPISGEPLVFSAPLRGDMAALVRDLRRRFHVERIPTPGTSVDLSQALPT
ncbi:MAG TPA: RluA family pseudouridine synthase, partial [Phycisphaerales bacterium]|nr:RluA family pseudouridine synthase [Phycisphaerales bacterium]